MPDRRPIPAWPRGLREELAAEYVGLSVPTLRREVAAGRAPKPTRLTRGRQVWLRDDLDAWLDRMAGRAPASAAADPWQEAIDGGSGDPAIRPDHHLTR